MGTLWRGKLYGDSVAINFMGTLGRGKGHGDPVAR